MTLEANAGAAKGKKLTLHAGAQLEWAKALKRTKSIQENVGKTQSNSLPRTSDSNHQLDASRIDINKIDWNQDMNRTESTHEIVTTQGKKMTLPADAEDHLNSVKKF